MISTPKMDKKVGLKRGYPLFICCVVGIAMYFTMILKGFYYHGTIMSIEKNKLGLGWAKLSPSWGLKLEFEVEV